MSWLSNSILNSIRIHPMFHVSLLELYHASMIPKKIHDPSPPIQIDGKHEYEVEDILDLVISNC
jgi:hypothetical protein